jgi:hypothetical protein
MNDGTGLVKKVLHEKLRPYLFGYGQNLGQLAWWEHLPFGKNRLA